jgi:hypothetical protein
MDRLGNAAAHLEMASKLGTKLDLEGASAEADQASKVARKAEQALDIVGIWPPARSVTVYLTSAAQAEQKAADLIVSALDTSDASLIKVAIKHQKKATYQLGRATKARDVLAAKYGRPCA